MGSNVEKTIALRFAENFAPSCGTIAAHQAVLDELGFVWYGKLGNPASIAISETILRNDDPRILLIHSGGQERYWAHIDCVQREVPEVGIPSYYISEAKDFGCWFRVRRFEKAPNKVMSRCTVASSGKPLTEASRHSMSPYFIINFAEEDA